MSITSLQTALPLFTSRPNPVSRPLFGQGPQGDAQDSQDSYDPQQPRVVVIPQPREHHWIRNTFLVIAGWMAVATLGAADYARDESWGPPKLIGKAVTSPIDTTLEMTGRGLETMVDIGKWGLGKATENLD